jgi:hypothetical protein
MCPPTKRFLVISSRTGLGGLATAHVALPAAPGEQPAAQQSEFTAADGLQVCSLSVRIARMRMLVVGQGLWK